MNPGTLLRTVQDEDAVARRHQDRVKGRARIGTLAQHYPCSRATIRVGLGQYLRTDTPIGGQWLPDKVELIYRSPNIRPRAGDRPDTITQRIATCQYRAADICTAPDLGGIVRPEHARLIGREWTNRISSCDGGEDDIRARRSVSLGEGRQTGIVRDGTARLSGIGSTRHVD